MTHKPKKVNHITPADAFKNLNLRNVFKKVSKKTYKLETANTHKIRVETSKDTFLFKNL